MDMVAWRSTLVALTRELLWTVPSEGVGLRHLRGVC